MLRSASIEVQRKTVQTAQASVQLWYITASNPEQHKLFHGPQQPFFLI